MSRFRNLMAAAVLSLGTGPAVASTLSDAYTSLWVFGDSLSDPGNLYALTGSPGAPYSDGRFSDGPVWSELVADDFAISGNFAYGGATASFNSPSVDFAEQVGLFVLSGAQALMGGTPLATVWFGANDLIATVGSPTQEAAAIGAADAVAFNIQSLMTLGISDFIVINLPDLGLTPYFQLIDPANATSASDWVDDYNTQLDANVDLLRLSGANIVEFDIHVLFDQLIENPTQFGFVDSATPCYIPGIGDCGALSPLLAFFDPLHPNSLVHAQIAERVEGLLAPVPLPAAGGTLLVGLLAFGAVRRRRTRA